MTPEENASAGPGRAAAHPSAWVNESA